MLFRFIALFLIVVSFTIGGVDNAQAQTTGACGTPGQLCLSPIDNTKGFKKVLNHAKQQFSKLKEKVNTSVDALKKGVNTKITLVELAIIKAAGGVSKTVSSTGVQIAKSGQKDDDSYHSKLVQMDRRLHSGEVAINAKPSVTDCIRATKFQNQQGAKVLNDAMSDVIVNTTIKNDLLNYDGLTGIEKVKKKFDDQMALFCDPDIPNMSDECASGVLRNSEKRPFFMEQITVNSNVGQAMQSYLDHIIPDVSGKRSIPEYRLSNEQRQYIDEQAKKVKAAISIKVLSDMAALRTGVTNKRQLADEMRERNLGSGIADEVMSFYAERPDTVSLAELRDIDQQSKLSMQNILDSIGDSDGEALRNTIAELVSNLETEYKGLQQDRKRSLFLALKYADMIN